ncbi:hypothetical protein [Streptomyces virginiae]|uniref:hypothetical protein n=1 Tax=Streptomyces virginiae TaxID=1961 RepID=UPI00225A8142|nr:hypothetical protein [Streptomyces virginiae]MCX4957895.1 hypothetical protein [Streptomyces virginiae]MCX5176626.1 hypothetical protein [Streptomyces virginiae]
MSRRTDNHHRAATICRAATGLPHRTCLGWAEAGLIDYRRPVPDAEDEGQRLLESLLVAELADGLREGDLRDGALFGFTSARPARAALALELHPAMADPVLAIVLPRIDQHYGGLRGVPGLRIVPTGRGWALIHLPGRTAVHLVHPDPDWRPVLPEHGDGLTQLWRRNRHRLHPAEAAELAGRADPEGDPGSVRAQDWLNSRLLRRPRLLGAAGAAHGSANVYTHGGGDVVVEWCCGVERDELERQLRRSGLAERPDRIAERLRDQPWFPGEIAMGGAFITLRRGPCYAPHPTARRAH